MHGPMSPTRHVMCLARSRLGVSTLSGGAGAAGARSQVAQGQAAAASRLHLAC